MRRKITIALIMLALVVAAMPLAATSALAANSPRQTSHASDCLTLPFAGTFSGKYNSHIGATTYTGHGFFLYCGLSKVDGARYVIYQPPFIMTIKTLTGSITLHVPYGSTTYQIDSGTGCFARVVGGTGHFSLHQSSRGTFSGSLQGTIVFA